MIRLTINGLEIEVPEGTTILQAALKANIHIPTLCYLPEVQAIGACRVCLVEVEGIGNLQASCVFPASNGLKVHTNTDKVRKARQFAVEMLLSNHPMDCLTSHRNLNCELQKIAHELGVTEIHFQGAKSKGGIDDSSPSIRRDNSKCILCRRCVSVCGNIQSVNALALQGRGFETRVEPAFLNGLAEVACTNCGQCTLVCPVGALTEKDDTQEVWNAISDPSKFVIIQDAPAVRAALGEEFGYPPGTLVTGKMLAAARKLGFDRVFDTNFAADLTIIEEGSELLKRVHEGGTLPLITSCSPGWIKFIEHFYPELLPHLSTCKSPHQMLGALCKTYFAEKEGINPKDMVVVSVMPCTAKKFECRRPEMKSAFHYWKEKLNLPEKDSFFDVDYVLTTRELARMFKVTGIDFSNLPE